MQYEIAHLRDTLRRERSYDILEFRLLRGDAASGELGLDLSKPDLVA